jgi:AcrR family transcriptional regulator
VAAAADSTKTQSWTRLDVDERRRQLIEIGGELFSDRSFDDISIDEIADAAGISKGLLYHYFPSKRDFYIEVIRTAADRLLDIAAGEQAAQAGDPLAAGLDAYLDYVEEHAEGYVMLMQGGIGSDHEVRAIVDGTRERFIRRILGGPIRMERPSPALRLAVRGWIGFVEGVTLDWLTDRGLSRAELRQLFTGALVAALAEAQRLDPELDLSQLGGS